MQQRLPIARVEENKLILMDAYEEDKYILCKLTGQMNDGTFVWTNEEDEKQYQRIKNLANTSL